METSDKISIFNKKSWIWRFGGIMSGLIFGLPHLYPILSPFQLVALIPIIYLCLCEDCRRHNLLAAGFYMGLAYTLPQIVSLRLPLLITAILLLRMTILMMILVIGLMVMDGNI